MAVAKTGTDTKGELSFGAPNTSLTFAKTVPAGSNILLVVGVWVDSATAVITGVTYNGNAMTSSGAAARANTSQYLQFWEQLIASPDGAAHDVVVSIDVSSLIAGFAVSWSGSNTGDPTGTVSYASQVASSATLSNAVTSATTEFVASFCMANAGSNPTPGGSQTEFDNPWVPLGGPGTKSYRAGVGGSTDSTYTPSGGFNVHSAAMNINAGSTDTVITPGAGSVPFTGRTLGLGFSINMPDVP